ncbi:DUF4129 domain-containing transglutaminase family protein [Massilia cavernae]|uniref:DUF4129 domain-containing protein n=1 Tax=Massilia cavernae TaxID=2320864 RepID=A0A418Y6Q1_9BURK|nr:transglutaminase domain-containing protein [Massilia cavernae]RJG23912.1 DUF4129 domain-containing protein [Massilia cavernae]
MAAEPVDERVRYEVTSFPDYSMQAGPRLPDRARWLALPYGFNPQAARTGAALQRISDPERRIEYVLKMFATDKYMYTLEPPRLGRHSVDEFLFDTKAGFCEHYAGAFVFLMRAAGVPARVVVGYQGGEINPVDGFMTVRQSDAHAWAEVWLPARGWQRIDPTAAVAPERVQRGSRRPAAPEYPFGIGALMEFGAGENGVAAQLRNYWDAVNNGWNQWVLNYTPQRQHKVLERLQALGSDPRVLGAIALLSTLLLFGRAWLVRRRADPIDALYSAMCQQLARHGMARAADEGPSAYARRLSQAGLPAAKSDAIARFMHLYSAYKYAAPVPYPNLAATLKRLLNESR